jgi:hypothetical protein
MRGRRNNRPAHLCPLISHRLHLQLCCHALTLRYWHHYCTGTIISSWDAGTIISSWDAAEIVSWHRNCGCNSTLFFCISTISALQWNRPVTGWEKSDKYTFVQIATALLTYCARTSRLISGSSMTPFRVRHSLKFIHYTFVCYLHAIIRFLKQFDTVAWTPLHE